MKFLLDTQIVIWVATNDPRLSPAARALIADANAQVIFSVASVWEISIKSALGRPDFGHSAAELRLGALGAGWQELVVTGEHAVAVAALPAVHGDPFDRLLIAQAQVEGMTLLTADRVLGHYGNPVRLV